MTGKCDFCNATAHVRFTAMRQQPGTSQVETLTIDTCWANDACLGTAVSRTYGWTVITGEVPR